MCTRPYGLLLSVRSYLRKLFAVQPSVLYRDAPFYLCISPSHVGVLLILLCMCRLHSFFRFCSCIGKLCPCVLINHQSVSIGRLNIFLLMLLVMFLILGIKTSTSLTLMLMIICTSVCPSQYLPNIVWQQV